MRKIFKWVILSESEYRKLVEYKRIVKDLLTFLCSFFGTPIFWGVQGVQIPPEVFLHSNVRHNEHKS